LIRNANYAGSARISFDRGGKEVERRGIKKAIGRNVKEVKGRV